MGTGEEPVISLGYHTYTLVLPGTLKCDILSRGSIRHCLEWVPCGTWEKPVISLGYHAYTLVLPGTLKCDILSRGSRRHCLEWVPCGTWEEPVISLGHHAFHPVPISVTDCPGGVDDAVKNTKTCSVPKVCELSFSAISFHTNTTTYLKSGCSHLDTKSYSFPPSILL
jgi:hypothetical protein